MAAAEAGPPLAAGRPIGAELLSRDLLIPVAHGVTYDEIRSVSPLLGSRNGLSTGEDSMEDIAEKIAELLAV